MTRSASGHTGEPGTGQHHANSPNGRLCLLVILRPKLTLAKSPGWPLKGFALNGKEYRDAALGEWTGFYDWLRAADGTLLGVRYWLNEETEFLTQEAEGLPYANVDPSRFVEIYFSDRRDIEPQQSADQDFLYDPVFRSDDGEYALGFAIKDLNESELRSIENAQANWCVFQPLEQAGGPDVGR
jgi:hypothetical protein